MYRCRRLVVVLLSLALVASFLIPFAAAEETEAWIILDVRYSNDGTNWTSRHEIQLINNSYSYGGYKYIKIDRIRVLNTTNKPSDLFISFSVSVHGYIGQNNNSPGAVYSNAQSNFSIDNSDVASGYFRYRLNGTYASPLDSYMQGTNLYFVGQYHINDVNSTAFTLTPDSEIYFGFTNSTDLMYYVHDVNIVFVGNDSQLYDINNNLVDIYSILDIWQDDWLDYHSEWLNNFYPRFTNIWTFLTQTNYSNLSFAGDGAGLNSSVTKNPFLALNNQLSAVVRYFNRIQKNQFSYDSITYDSDGIGTVTTVENVPWFDALLGQLAGQSAIDQHHMEEENEAKEQGAGDAYDNLLGHASSSWAIFDGIDGIYQIGDDQSVSAGYEDCVTAAQHWYSVENRNMINNTIENPNDPEFERSIWELDRSGFTVDQILQEAVNQLYDDG